MSDFDRRTLLAGAAGASLTALLSGSPGAAAAQRRPTRRFPRGFRWGVAGAGHQIEGNNVNSDLWHLENTRPTTFIDRSGDACDSYHRFEEDISLLARLGFNSYRFSIEWARIEPTPGAFSVAELDHYKRMIASCHRHNVAPVVTYIHNAHPRWFAAAGGWLNPESPQLFERYCTAATRALGDGMAFALTMNEPQVARNYRSIPGAEAYFRNGDIRERASHAAAARACGSDRFVSMNFPDIEGMTPNLLNGHARGYAAIKAERSALPVSVTLNMVDFQPGNEGAREPVAQMTRRLYDDWFEAVRNHGDFVAVQAYRQMRVPGAGPALPAPPPLPYLPANSPMAAMSQPIAFRNTVELAHRATRKPVMITENGIETDNDVRRVWYIEQVMGHLADMIADGVPILGYLHWSLLDNFEWNRGYAPHFGLVAVDRTTFRRTPKPSAARLGAIARANRF